MEAGKEFNKNFKSFLIQSGVLLGGILFMVVDYYFDHYAVKYIVSLFSG